MKVKLSTVAENIDMHDLDYQIFFDKQSYQIVLITENALTKAEDGEPYNHLPEWQQEERKQAE